MMKTTQIEVSLIEHSFVDKVTYFFEKTYATVGPPKEIGADEVLDHLKPNQVILLLDKEFTLVLRTPNVPPPLAQLNALLNKYKAEDYFTTDYLSCFGKTTTIRGGIDDTNFKVTIKQQKEVVANGNFSLTPTLFSKIFGRFFPKRKEPKTKLEKLLHHFKSVFKHDKLNALTLSNCVYQVYTMEKEVTVYVNSNSRATLHAPFSADPLKMEGLLPSTNGIQLPQLWADEHTIMTEELYQKAKREQIRFCSINPAYVLQHNPFVVAVYSSSLDCSIILRFPSKIGKVLQSKYKVADRLVAINGYHQIAESGVADGGVEIDLIEGPNSNGYWKNVSPVIAEFITVDDDLPIINYYKNKVFKQKDWNRLRDLRQAYHKKYPGASRIGLLIMHRYPTQTFTETFFPEKA